MPFWAEIAVTVFLVIAGLFGLVGSYGLVRLPDPMSRLHAPTKATTLGVGGVLIASILYFYGLEGRIHEVRVFSRALAAGEIQERYTAMRERSAWSSSAETAFSDMVKPSFIVCGQCRDAVP